jgi:hypothetical protein
MWGKQHCWPRGRWLGRPLGQNPPHRAAASPVNHAAAAAAAVVKVMHVGRQSTHCCLCLCISTAPLHKTRHAMHNVPGYPAPSKNSAMEPSAQIPYTKLAVSWQYDIDTVEKTDKLNHVKTRNVSASHLLRATRKACRRLRLPALSSPTASPGPADLRQTWRNNNETTCLAISPPAMHTSAARASSLHQTDYPLTLCVQTTQTTQNWNMYTSHLLDTTRKACRSLRLPAPSSPTASPGPAAAAAATPSTAHACCCQRSR